MKYACKSGYGSLLKLLDIPDMQTVAGALLTGYPYDFQTTLIASTHRIEIRYMDNFGYVLALKRRL